ncbi:MAG: hypothetical protein PHN84_06405 [Desulfuromonadaceae bacterium]|nr:hypothetical protein [Desulfuromonadaceae bacterium]MDD2855388.1 hypothetical protein [Desulfuromonadaceae bacterium]
MSQIKPSHLLLIGIFSLSLAACGDKNENVVFSPEGGHSAGWVTSHKAITEAELETCAECHGEEYEGGISRVSCMSESSVSGFTCHFTSPVENPVGCVSCHGGMPSGPFGDTAPNVKSAHALHTALPGVGCYTCHEDAGSGGVSHAKANPEGELSNATLSFPSTYKANANVAISYNNGACANVSCHGGKVTPNWTSTINIVANDDTVCLQCHEQGTLPGNPQFNSFYSGNYSDTNLHKYHLDNGAKCTECHNIGRLTDYQNHFSGLATRTMPLSATTVGAAPTRISVYNIPTKSCTTTCHTIAPLLPTASWIEAQ